MAEQHKTTLSFSVQGQKGEIPQVGLGSATLKGDTCVEAVSTAISVGYKLIDTALLYDNQVEVGEGIRKSGIARDQIWITSKVGFFPDSTPVWMYNDNNRKGDEAASIDLTLKQIGVDHVDLLLLHNPTSSAAEYNAACLPHFFEFFSYYKNPMAIPKSLPDGTDLRVLISNAKRQQAKAEVDPVASYEIRRKSWLALEQAQREGKCKYIGVSNYPVELILEMKRYATVMPAINQLELHPGYSSPELRRVAKELGMVLIGYGTGTYVGLAKAPEVAELAKKMNVTENQLVARWTTQSGVAIIPRSRSKDHLIENLETNAFTIAPEDMAILEGLNHDYPYYWDPLATTQLLKD